MFNDHFGLTDAVLSGRKTVTRRIVTGIYGASYIDDHPTRIDEVQRPTVNSRYIKNHLPKYKVGEVLAIAQCYENIAETLREPYLTDSKCWMPNSAGWNNKMFVKAELMPHQIEIIDVRVERLQDITDEDCIKEGIKKFTKDGTVYKYGFDGLRWQDMPSSPREAFASLIDKVAKKGTWKSNPYVFINEFKLK